MTQPVYKIISAAGSDEFTTAIREATAEGWQVFGGICRVSYSDAATQQIIVISYQAVVKMQDPEASPR